jgi:hypothetical protein
VPEGRATPPAPVAAEPVKKRFPLALVAAIVGAVVVAGGGALWYFSSRKVQTPPPSVTALPRGTRPAPAPPAAGPAPVVSPAASVPAKKARVAKPAPAPAPAPAAPAANPKAEQITKLQNLAREAYAKGNFAEPPAASALAYAKQVLELDPANDYAKTLLENSANGGKYQVQQAILRKDFASAHRTAEALTQLLPGRTDIAGLKEDIASAERAEEAARRPKPVATPDVIFRAYHMHSEKAPADKGPYCLGNLSVLTGRIKFAGESASDGQVHNLEFACSDAREIKKNARVASHQNGFHIRTASSNINFVPEDSSAAHISALASACSK